MADFLKYQHLAESSVYYHFFSIQVLGAVFTSLIAAGFYALFERKFMGIIQRRIGPNIQGIWGLLQFFCDGLKLILKEIAIPKNSYTWLFILCPLVTFIMALIQVTIIPFSPFAACTESQFNLFYILILSAITLYSTVLAGIVSNSIYSLMGSIRLAAQMISYEIALTFIVLIAGTLHSSFNSITIIENQNPEPVINYCSQEFKISIAFVTNILHYYFFLNNFSAFCFVPVAILFLICIFAETNRTPFDLPENEAELVAGYHVEYSAIPFAAFFLAEYANMLSASVLFCIIFLGNPQSLIPFSLKVFFAAMLFIWVRSSFPRYRYDILMQIGWKILLPLTIANWFLAACLVFTTNSFIDIFSFIL